jgi:hypothetical protein
MPMGFYGHREGDKFNGTPVLRKFFFPIASICDISPFFYRSIMAYSRGTADVICRASMECKRA